MTDQDLQDISGLAGLPLAAVTCAAAVTLGQTRLAVLVVVGIALGYTLTMGMKALYFRPRPRSRPYATRWERLTANSFPSVHAMRAGVLWSLLALYLPHPGWRAVCLLAVVLVGWTRVKLGEHHLADTLVGTVVGGVSGLAAFVACSGVWGVS
jgi:membrane-associated phospholipid phosphatase